ncbi:MAG: hypothetical protein JO091_13110 [Acidobacteriaceae bacterium]|nr:hypothetical protein [Acidobacteriaceae bacterium]
MKRHLKHIILTAGLSALLGTVAVSAQDQTEVAEIPFAFHANHQLLPAGKYTVSQRNVNGLFQLSNGEGQGLFVSMIDEGDKSGGDPKLSFRCYGNERVLASIWTADGTKYTVSDSSIEKDLHRRIDMSALISVRLTAR